MAEGWTDPATVGILVTGVVAIGGLVINARKEVDNTRRYAERLKQVVDSLPDHEPASTAPLAQQIRWVEALDAYDRMTQPRSRRLLAASALISGLLLCLVGVSWIAYSFAIPVDKSGGWFERVEMPPRLFAGTYPFAIGLWAVLQFNRLWYARFRLGGRRLQRDSSSLDRIRDLRARLGVATDEDSLAYKRTEADQDRWNRRQAWIEKLIPALSAERPRVTDERSTDAPRGEAGGNVA